VFHSHRQTAAIAESSEDPHEARRSFRCLEEFSVMRTYLAAKKRRKREVNSASKGQSQEGNDSELIARDLHSSPRVFCRRFPEPTMRALRQIY